MTHGDIERDETYDHHCPEMSFDNYGRMNTTRQQCLRRQQPGYGCHGTKCQASVVRRADSFSREAESRPFQDVKPGIQLGVDIPEDPQAVAARQGIKLDPQKRDSGRVCTIEGCGLPHVAKGLCYGHYWEKRKAEMRKGRLEKTCDVDGCSLKHYAKGKCKKHYRTPKALARKKKSEVNQAAKAVPRICSVEGCDNKHLAKGLCCKHYNREKVAAERRSPHKEAPAIKSTGKSSYDSLIKVAASRGVPIEELAARLSELEAG